MKKRDYIAPYFKAVKQNFDLKAQVFSLNSFEKYVEFVQLNFAWMIANFSSPCQRPGASQGFP
ncbi:MAG: hypothetical protein GX457_16305 [Thermotogaceae bacterium]|nr:hypothetical protein [Thermotogaceae bacterium]